jgi:predicted metalloprotease with PDZ domain
VNGTRVMMLTLALLAASLLAGHAGAQSAAASPPAPATPATPATPAAPAVPADLEAQLDVARKRLEEAANEVAQLSTRMSGSYIQGLAPYVGTSRAIIGVQLDANAGSAGARVSAVSPGGPAAAAGIRVGDVIVAVNGHSVSGEESVREVLGFMREVKPESRVNLKVLREGQTREVTVTTRAEPGLFITAHDMPSIELPPLPELRGAFMFRRPLMDMELATLTPRLGSYFGSDHGVLVVRAPADGVLQLQDGDVILAIDGREPTSGSHATRILSSYQPGEKIRLRLLRQHKSLDVDTTLPQEPEHGHRELMHERRSAPHSAPQRPVIYGSDAA